MTLTTEGQHDATSAPDQRVGRARRTKPCDDGDEPVVTRTFGWLALPSYAVVAPPVRDK